MPKKVETELECPPFQTKGEALRWVLHGPELALPSVDRTSYAAMEKLRGRVDNRSPMADDSGIPSRRKLDLLTAAHEDASHIGGRAAVAKALAEEGSTWTNLILDAQWVIHRCVRCRQTSARGPLQLSHDTFPSRAQQGR